MSATPSDHRSAAAIATGAGERLVELRKLLDERDAHPHLRRAMGDKLAHDYIVAELARDHPDDAVLSEEGADDVARLTAERVWIVDPLDGTREFGEQGRSDWAVHIALVIDGAVAAAAVALPAHGLTLTAVPPPEPPARISPDGPPRLVVSRSRPPADRHRGRPTHRRACSCRSARPAPRRWRSCSAKPTSMHIAAVSTSGTPPRRSASPPPPGCTCRASTGRRSCTTAPIRGSPTS